MFESPRVQYVLGFSLEDKRRKLFNNLKELHGFLAKHPDFNKDTPLWIATKIPIPKRRKKQALRDKGTKSPYLEAKANRKRNTRKCLSCDKDFESAGAANRRCEDCSKLSRHR